MNISVKHMNLTNDSQNITKGIATISIDDCFNIEGVTVKRSKEDKLYVQLPQRSYYDKETQEKGIKMLVILLIKKQEKKYQKLF